MGVSQHVNLQRTAELSVAPTVRLETITPCSEMHIWIAAPGFGVSLSLYCSHPGPLSLFMHCAGRPASSLIVSFVFVPFIVVTQKH